MSNKGISKTVCDGKRHFKDPNFAFLVSDELSICSGSLALLLGLVSLIGCVA